MGRTFALRSLSPMGTWKPQSGRKGGLIERTPGRDERGIARRKRTPRGTEPGARAHRRGRGSATGRQEGVGPGAAGQAAEHPRPAGVVGVAAHEPFEHSAAGPAAGRLPVTRRGLHRLRGARACRLFPRLSSCPRPDPPPTGRSGQPLAFPWPSGSLYCASRKGETLAGMSWTVTEPAVGKGVCTEQRKGPGE